MPYHIGDKGSYGCKGFPVVKDSDGEVMGCHTTEESAKRQLAALYANEPEASKGADSGFAPPQEVRSNAKRGLELRDKYGRGGTEVGVARARDLSNGRSVSLDTIKRMVSYFARHEVDKQGEGWGKDSAGYIAWLLWGGDAGKTWANKINNENKKKDKAMAMDYATSYAAIVKYDKNDDGTLMVYGKATDDTLDLDSQICDPKWLDEAMPRWFKSGGNIREMHGPSAAGIAKEYEAKTDGHYIGVHVVDPLAAKKVETGVYQGFSIGIKSPRVVRDAKAANGRIVDGSIIEVSLVDRPANPSAKLILAKAVEGETSLVQVEELHEFKAPLPSDVFKKEETDYESINEGGEKSEPADKELYNRIKGEAKKKFDVYPSAVANAWVVREYKSRGGTYKKKTKKTDDTGKGSKMETIKQITELAKSLTPNSVKFDQATFDAARRAVAELIVIEAKEMAEEGDETYSLTQLVEVAEHLMAWYQGEIQEGETMSETIELAASEESDTTGCDCEGCKECKADGGCDSKMCKMHKETMADKSLNKCLQCGCHNVTDTHGLTHVTIPSGSNPNPMVEPAKVSTAEIVDYTKSADADETVEATEEVAVETTEEVSEAVEATDVTSIEDVVEKAVKSAMESVKAEIASLRADKEAAVEKSVKLESDLATALSKSVAGGPKRTATKMSDEALSDALVKAATYKAKADATTDPVLAKGYRALHAEFLAKANPVTSN